MNRININVKLDIDAELPIKTYDVDAGFDIKTRWAVLVPAHGSVVVDTGIHFEIPAGYCGFIKSKSGLNNKYGLRAEGVIDSGYTGSVQVKMYNDSSDDYQFQPGDKLTQIVFLPIPHVALFEVKEFKQTERGDNGFGSTGR